MEQFSENLRYVFNRMWRMGYGTVRGLHFRDGDPLLDPPFDVVRTVRLPDSSPPRQLVITSHCPPNREHFAFQRELAAIGTGVIDVVKVHDGLPVGLEIHEQP